MPKTAPLPPQSARTPADPPAASPRHAPRRAESGGAPASKQREVYFRPSPSSQTAATVAPAAPLFPPAAAHARVPGGAGLPARAPSSDVGGGDWSLEPGGPSRAVAGREGWGDVGGCWLLRTGYRWDGWGMVLSSGAAEAVVAARSAELGLTCFVGWSCDVVGWGLRDVNVRERGGMGGKEMGRDGARWVDWGLFLDVRFMERGV